MKRQPRRWRRRTHNLVAVLALGSLACGVTSCAATAPSDEVRTELARLRQEHRALREEISRLREALVAGEDAAEDGKPIAQPHATPATPTAMPRAAIVAVLDSYRRAVEAEDLERLRDDLYGGELPEQDSRYLTIWFDNADMLEVQLEPLAIDVNDGRASALVRQTMRFRLSRTAERRTVRLQLRIRLEQSGRGWQVRELKPQR